MSKENRIRELINKYNEWDNCDDGNKNMLSCIARDNKRQIAKVFEKKFFACFE